MTIDLREGTGRGGARVVSSVEGRGGATAVGAGIGKSTGSTEPTLGALVASATRDLQSLVHDEIALGKAELRDDVKKVAAGSGMFAVAGALAFLATFALTFAFAYGLVALGIWTWLAFLIVTVVYLALAGLLAFIGFKKVKKVKPPERTIETTKDTVASIKGAASS